MSLKKIFISIIMFLIVVILIISSTMLYNEFIPIISEKNIHTKIDIYAPTNSNLLIENLEDLNTPDFASLSIENSETKAWIQVPNTNISYPIVQGTNNAKYLNTDFLGSKSKYGTLFLDSSVNSNFSEKLNIIYGHNIPNTHVMFTDLEYFLNPDFSASTPNFYIYTPTKNHLAKIFSINVVNENSEIYNYSIFDAENIDSIKSTLQNNSISFVENNFPQKDNQIIMLSTCFKEQNGKFGNKRIVILASI